MKTFLDILFKGFLFLVGLLFYLDGVAQGSGFALVVEDNTPHIDNTLYEKTVAFFQHNPVRTDVAFDVADEWRDWEDKINENPREIVAHFKRDHPHSSSVIRLVFSPAPEIEGDAIKLTFSIWSLNPNKRFDDIDVLYIYNDDNLTGSVLPLIRGHIRDILYGAGKKGRTLYLKSDDKLLKSCSRFRDVFVRLFRFPELFNSFCVVADNVDHQVMIYGEKNHKSMVFTYHNPGPGKSPQFIADCQCDLSSVEQSLIDFIKKVTNHEKY